MSDYESQVDDLPLLQSAREARDEAIVRVDANALDQWKEEADRAARDVSRRFREFTSDQVFELMDQRNIDRPSEPRAMGPVMQRLVNSGFAKPTDRTRNSTHKSCHARPKRLYQSTQRIASTEGTAQ